MYIMDILICKVVCILLICERCGICSFFFHVSAIHVLYKKLYFIMYLIHTTSKDS